MSRRQLAENLHLRSSRVWDALTEMRVARRIGRMLTQAEADRLQRCQPDELRLRQLVLESGGHLSARGGRLTAIF